DVLKTVQVHIQEHRLPRPLRSLDAAEVRNLRVSAVATIPEKRIARDFWAILEVAWDWEGGLHPADLPHPARVLAAHHFDHEKVQMAVAVDVGEVHSH